MSEVKVICVSLKEILGEAEKKGSRLLQQLKPIKDLDNDEDVRDVLTDCVAVKMVQEVVWAAVPEEITAVADKFVSDMMNAVDLKGLSFDDEEEA